MKKALSLFLALVICLSLCLTLCACGSEDEQAKPKGTYTATMAGIKYATLTFSGDNVTYAGKTRTTNGTFKMRGNTVVISYENGNSDELVYDTEADTLTLAGLVFEKK